MKKLQRVFLTLAAALSGHLTLSAQNAPVPFEAETGVSAGAPITGAMQGDWATRTIAATGPTPAITYVTSLTDVASIPGGGAFPGNNNRVLSYTVTFPGPGTYDLYARVRIGSGGANDDSFFYGNGFGSKSVTTGSDWTSANNVFNIGYTGGTQTVDGGGGAATGVWKWIDISKYSFGGQALVAYTVPAGNLTQTFQIGAREDGMDFDKFVFGQSGLYFTVANLDAGQQGSTTPPVIFTPTGPPIATGKPKYLGNVYVQNEIPNFGAYFNAVTPGNAGKWGSVEGTRGTFNWTELDAAYAQAQAVNGVFRMHTLIWGAQQPTWMYNLSPADQLTEINNWFAAVATHFQGRKIDFIDVVNEPIHTPPTGFVTVGSPTAPTGSVAADGGAYINALGGTGTTGYDWIINAFQLARQYFPNAKLMINEYSVENSAASAATYVTIINLLKARGLIDGVGIQAHAFSFNGISTATIQANLATMATTNLPLYATEFDIDGPTDAVQLAEYQRVFPLFWENPAVRSVTLWGARVGHWRTAQGDNLINDDNTERPAFVWLKNYIATTYTGPMWTGNTSPAWNTATNWITGNGAPTNSAVSAASTYTVPLATDDAVFPSYAANQPVVSGAQGIRSVTLSGTSATLTTPAGSVLTMTGNLTNNGGALAGSGDGTIVLGGSAAQTIGGSSPSTFQNLTVGATTTASLTAPAQVRRLLTLNSNLATGGQPFTLLSDASGTAMVVNSGGVVSGMATVQRYIDPSLNAGNGYRHYSAPVAATTVADLATPGFTPMVNPAYNTTGNTVTPFPTVFDYNTSRLMASASPLTSAFDYGWESPAALTDALTPGLGYSVNLNGAQLVDFVGTLNNGSISRGGLTRSAFADAGWQLLGNPYPAPLDWNLLSSTGLDNAVYVFKSSGQYAGQYAAYVNGIGTNGGTNQLAAMQGFFVRTTSAATPGSLTFTNAARLTTYASPVFQRGTSTDPLVRLALSTAAGLADEAVVYFPTGATTGFDAQADAYKLPAPASPLLASELSTSELLAINALPALGATDVAVPLRLTVPQAGTFTLRATELLNLPAGRYAYLRDAQTGTMFDLSQSTAYSVNLAAGAAATGRFALVITANRVLATASAALSQQVSVYPNPAHGGSISLSLPAALGQHAVEVSLLNALGQTVLHQTLSASADVVRPLTLPVLAAGIYTVRLQTTAGTITKRLTVN